MRRATLLLCLFVPCLSVMAPAAGLRAEPPQGFTPLFNGRDLDGWQGLVGDPKKRAAMSADELQQAQRTADARMREHWQVVDGVLEFDGGGDNLCTTKEYGDFELLVDWKILPGGDSGIYLRGSPQVQIWDTAHEPYFRLGADKGSGALWNNERHERFPRVKADKPAGEWNSFRILMVGERLSVWLNETLVFDHVVMENYWDRSRPIYPRGPIELQNHGNKLWFRNLAVREIGAEEAARLLARDEDQFHAVFNGRDLDGWRGDRENYVVQDGAIVCREGHGGNLFTDREYGDFTVRFEFRLPPGGNNGLAIRYPGEGQPHLTAVELQVLDNEHPKYASLDPRQYHGSVYGLIPAQRGYLRATGEWNCQEVTVRGSHYHVELNGFTILDADLAAVQESKDGAVPEGARRTRGHFGFAGHNDPVAFRNVRIRE